MRLADGALTHSSYLAPRTSSPPRYDTNLKLMLMLKLRILPPSSDVCLMAAWRGGHRGCRQGLEEEEGVGTDREPHHDRWITIVRLIGLLVTSLPI